MRFQIITFIKTSLLLCLFGIVDSGFSQNVNDKIDSLKTALKNQQNIHLRIDLLNQISDLYNQTNPDSAILYSDQAILLARRNNTKNQFANTYLQRGIAFKNKGFIDSAQNYLFKAIELFEASKDTKNIIQANIAIAEFYRSSRNLSRATEFIKIAINISKEKHIEPFLPYAYNRFGAIVFEMAFRDFQGTQIIDKKYLKSAIQYVDSSFFWSTKNKTNIYQLSNYNILGACYQSLSENNKAITFFEKALNTADSTGEIIEKPIIYRNLGSNYAIIKNFEKALSFSLKGFHLADSLSIKNNLIFTAINVSSVYKEMGDHQNALKYLIISDSIKAIMYDESFLSKTKEFEAKYENQKKQIQIEQLANERELQNAEMKKQRLIIYSFIFFFVIILVLLLVIYRFFKQNKKASEIISGKNKTLEIAYSEINQQNEKIKSQNEEITQVNEQLQEFNTELENKVNARTLELQEKNEEIEAQNEIYKQINEELNIAKEKSEENDRLKSAFLANMSHEIRTPLNGILGFSRLLTNMDVDPEDQNHYIEIINNSGQQLITLIDDIIDMAKIEVNQVKLFYKPINLNNLINEIGSLFQSKSESTGILFTSYKDLSDEQSIIITDAARLRQVLINLVGNAFKFTQHGFIKLSYIIKNDFIEFSVQDTGIGIAQEKHELIFDRFRQAEINTSQTYGGTGLGLSISKSLIQLMEGSMHVESELQKGSIFYFTIPFKKANPDSISTNTASKVQIKPQSNKVILVAEDEENNFLLIKTILSKLNYTILRAHNGKEAIDLTSQIKEISIVLMDIKMPDITGYEAIVEIRKTRSNIPVIAQTAYAQAGDKKKALEMGFTEYITKPLDPRLLIELIEKNILK